MDILKYYWIFKYFCQFLLCKKQLKKKLKSNQLENKMKMKIMSHGVQSKILDQLPNSSIEYWA